MSRLVVLGAGESGVGAAVLAAKRGLEVFVSDMGVIRPRYREMLLQAGIAFEEGQHTEELILNADEVVKSPGIPDKAPIIKHLHARNVPIISEIEFGARYTNATMICITGSNGKTTTTMLLYHILQTAGYNVGLAGNVGTSLALQVAQGDFDYYVVELSSFQLEGMYDFHAHEAILLNITPDHLDRYNYQMQNYVDAKMRLVRNQTLDDSFIYWKNDPILEQEVQAKTIGSALYTFTLLDDNQSQAYVKEDALRLNVPGREEVRFPLAELAIKGNHNVLNAMAAGLVALRVNVSEEALCKAYRTFKGVEHRLEKVGIVNGVTYINDSKATNVNSCYYALSSMSAPTVLILGGTDKGNDYTEIETLVQDKARALVFMGVDNTALHAFFDSKGTPMADAGSMQEALSLARSFAHEGDCVLLSPCCASFDLFMNYEDRGRQFKEGVKKMME